MSRTRSRLPRIWLLAGYVGLTLAVVVARGTPADGYEISVYGATPTATWVALGVALAIGAVVALTEPRERYVHTAALTLIGAVTVAVFAMPILRGYAFYGAGDSLSHVGWAREIATGTLAPTELLYPGIHTLTVGVSSVAAVSLRLANLYVVLVAIPLVFLLFVPATARLLVDRPGVRVVALLAAAAFAPINNVAVHANAHPASQAIFLFAFVLYLSLAYVSGSLEDGRPARGTDRVRKWNGHSPYGSGALLGLALVAMVLVHPQQALNVAAFLGGIVALQFVTRRRWSSHPIAATRSLLPHTALILTAFFLWTPRFERASGAVLAAVDGLLQSGATGAAVVGAKSTSLTSVGGSLLEVFLKLFGAAAVLSLLAVGVFLLAARNHRRHPLLILVAAGLVPMAGVFLVVFAADLGDMYFRYQGFMMVPVTVLGAVGLLGLREWLGDVGGDRAGTAVALALLLVIAPAGLAAVHNSPYVYQPSQHVTAEHLDGHASAFETRDPDVPFTGLRSGPRRYVDYHYGTEQARDELEFPGYREGVGSGVFTAANYSSAFEEPRYLTTTEAARQQETELYDGFRFSERGFRALETTPGVDRVRTNDGFRLYYVEGGGE